MEIAEVVVGKKEAVIVATVKPGGLTVMTMQRLKSIHSSRSCKHESKRSKVAFCAPAVDQKEIRRHSMDIKMTRTKTALESR